MRFIVFDETNISCTYLTSKEDRRVIVNGWRDLFKVYNIKIGNKIIAVLHPRDAGPFLFLHTILLAAVE
jgi:hypothetical protein